jgi:hypothetical protein
MDSQNENQIIKSFCVCGLNDSNLQKYTEEPEFPYIQNVDLVEKNISISMDTIEMTGEKW